jgi:arylamine N-acetyltransferase
MANGFGEIDSPASQEWVRDYLDLIGGRDDAPSYDALSDLMRRQITAIPFENLTSILRRYEHLSDPVPAPNPDELLDNWRRKQGGGVCYELSAMFARLLNALGYDARLVLGQISIPGGHQAIVVELSDERYLVDVGSGSPLFEPVPLNQVFEVQRAGLGFRFRPGDADHQMWAQDRWLDDAWVQHCRYDLRPISGDVRMSAYQHHHTPGASWVIGAPRVVRCGEEAVARMIGDEFTHFSASDKRKERVEGPEQFAVLATDIFGLPAMPVAEAFRAQAEMTANLTTN